MTWRKGNRTESPEIRIWTDYLHVWQIRQQLHSSEGGFSDRPIELMILSLINWWCAAWQQRYQLGETERHVFGLTVIRSFGLMSSKKKKKKGRNANSCEDFDSLVISMCSVVKKVTHAVCRWFKKLRGKNNTLSQTKKLLPAANTLIKQKCCMCSDFFFLFFFN